MAIELELGMGKVELLCVLELFSNSSFRIQNFETVQMKLDAFWQNNMIIRITADFFGVIISLQNMFIAVQ